MHSEPEKSIAADNSVVSSLTEAQRINNTLISLCDSLIKVKFSGAGSAFKIVSRKNLDTDNAEDSSHMCAKNM